jgi:hypothetical protein
MLIELYYNKKKTLLKKQKKISEKNHGFAATRFVKICNEQGLDFEKVCIIRIHKNMKVYFSFFLVCAHVERSTQLVKDKLSFLGLTTSYNVKQI